MTSEEDLNATSDTAVPMAPNDSPVHGGNSGSAATSRDKGSTEGKGYEKRASEKNNAGGKKVDGHTTDVDAEKKAATEHTGEEGERDGGREADNRGCSDDNSNESIKDDESEAEQFRRLIAPLSKEQLIDILATSAIIHDDIRDKCNEAVAVSPSTRRLMVRNIPFCTKDEQFIKYFETFGEIEDGIIVREKEGRSKGYGFITYKFVDSVKACLKSSHTIENKELQVRLVADPFSDQYQNKIFVRNLSQKTDVNTLRSIFEKYGKLEECVIIHDNAGKSKGYGFLTFSSPKEAFKVMQQPERIIDSRVVFLHFAVSQNNKKFQNSNSNNNINNLIGNNNFMNSNNMNHNNAFIKRHHAFNNFPKIAGNTSNANNTNAANVSNKKNATSVNNFSRRNPMFQENDASNNFNYPNPFVPNMYTNIPQGYQFNYPNNMDSYNAYYNTQRY